MEDRSRLPALLLVLALHLVWGIERRGYYTNMFAVQVDGDSGVASLVAESHGVTNLGLVSFFATL